VKLRLITAKTIYAVYAVALTLLLGAIRPTWGQNSDNGAVGRTIGLDGICGACKVEKFTDACLGRLEAPNFDKEGNLWLVSHATGEIYRVTPDGKCEEIAHTSAPNGLRFHKDGRLFGVDHHEGIFWLDTKTRKTTFLTNQFHSGNFAGLDDLFFDKTGGLYMTDAWGSSVLNPSGRVFYLAADGKLRRAISGNLAFPNGVVLSPDEHVLYVDDFGTNRILAIPVESPGVLNTDGAWVFAYLNGGHGPDSLTADANGNLYVAHHSAGEVVVFSPRGFLYGSIRLPEGAGMVPSNVAFHEGYLYITEMDQHTIWRVKTKIPGMKLFGDQ
jgi:gluconolactonase